MMNLRLMLAVSVMLSGCANTLQIQQDAALLRIQGDIEQPRHVAPTPAVDTTIRVQLQEVRRDDPTQMRVIAQQTLQNIAPHQAKTPFSFCVSPSKLQATHRYQVRAQVYQDGALQLSSPTPIEWTPALAADSLLLPVQALSTPIMRKP